MRALIQRVSRAGVAIDGKEISRIGQGLLILLGIEAADGDDDIQWLVNKIAGLRIFDDADGVMNLSVKDIHGEALVFRPSYIDSAPPAISIPLYEQFIRVLGGELEKPVQTGEFGAMMQVSLVNDGPVTIWIDTKNKL